MEVLTIISMGMGMLQAKYICDALFYIIGFYKRDRVLCRWLNLGDEVKGSTSFNLDIALCIVIYTGYIFVIYTLSTEGNNVEFSKLTFYLMTSLAIITRFIQAIKSKMYKNIQYNKICDTLDRVDILMDSIKDGQDNINHAYGDAAEKYKILNNLYDILNQIRNELIYTKSISGLYKVVNIADELNKDGSNSDNISLLIREIDKLNAYSELSNKQLNSLYETLRNQVISN